MLMHERKKRKSVDGSVDIGISPPAAYVPYRQNIARTQLIVTAIGITRGLPIQKIESMTRLSSKKKKPDSDRQLAYQFRWLQAQVHYQRLVIYCRQSHGRSQATTQRPRGTLSDAPWELSFY